MSVNSKIPAAAAGAILTAGLALAAAGPASASSAGCAFSNGCATLHGFDAASHSVAMDAKYQSSKPGTLVIGYPDNPGDGATSFDAVLHYATQRTDPAAASGVEFASNTGSSWFRGSAPLAYSAASQKVTKYGIELDTHPVSPVGSPYADSGVIVSLGTVASLGCTGTDFAGVPVSGSGNVAVNLFEDTSGNGDYGTWDGSEYVTGTLHGLPVTAGDDTVFDDVNQTAVTCADITAAENSAEGSATRVWAWAGISGSRAQAAVVSSVDNEALVTGGSRVQVPYYTFAYARGGVWSNECVTDTNGSGALTLQTCTLGKDTGQDFSALSGGAPSVLGSSPVAVQNWLAAAADSAASCLTDPSSLLPSTPQSNATDETASPAGRQLRTDGSCTAATWTWAS